ncbi:Ankyrin repeat domain-containing protein 33 [Myotis davidii]|uniref:Ankyrin repeat domain-containing protein 33 n=1 Tax=Myotis davidii TaxID=225400 RepID=L5MC79_MYODS|nr:Ankyrin repeat domain-containing protein 33 [Myotis davidii]
MPEAPSCPDSETPAPDCRLGALYWACVRNDSAQLQAVLEDGVSPEEATQVDGNGRTGLMVACYLGFGSIVALLSRCPFLDVNQQDKESDTALMLAAQAGGRLLTHPLPVPVSRPGHRSTLCMTFSHTTLQRWMEGADLTAVDPVWGKTALEWAVLTDSFHTMRRIRQLRRRPQAEQLGQHYQPEWPALPGLVAQAQAQVAPSLLERLQATLNLPFAQSPQEGGVLDHLVTITTSLASPFLTTACHTLCPDHPPALGTRSKSVPELLGTAPPTPSPPASTGGPWPPGPRPSPKPSSCAEHIPPPPPQPPSFHRWSLAPRVSYPHQSPQAVLSMCPQWLQPRDSASPKPAVPQILLSKAPSSPSRHEPEPRPAGHRRLTPPVWRYQELRMQRRSQEKEAGCAQGQGKMG